MSSKDKSSPRMLVALVGDIVNDQQTQVKYGTLIEALDRQFSVVDVCNAKLNGLSWLLNSLWTWHPKKSKWRERATKTPFAFSQRSKKVASWVKSNIGQADVLLQLGVLFYPDLDRMPIRQIIYTDYTAQLSAKQPFRGRSPHTGRSLQRWLDLERRAMEGAAHICVRSNYVRDSLLADYGVSSNRVSVIGGGVNLHTIPKLPTFQSTHHAPVALFIGSDFYRKGGDLVLHAFASARRQLPDARLLLLTKDPIPKDLPMDGVTLLLPTWNREELISLYRQADLFVMPSRLETWGDVFLEAMAFGLPCIGVHGQAMSEIIRHGETGLLVEPNHVKDLENAMVDLFTHPEKRLQMGKSANELVSREYTWDRVVDRMTSVIASII